MGVFVIFWVVSDTISAVHGRGCIDSQLHEHQINKCRLGQVATAFYLSGNLQIVIFEARNSICRLVFLSTNAPLKLICGDEKRECLSDVD